MPTNYAEIATKYAQDVLDGTIPSCRQIKLAAQRHISDLDRADSESFPYRFDQKKANRICKFAELLPHVKGKWAQKKELLHLEPWQVFILASVFGWVSKLTGLRRFRQALILVSRKNGKSLLSSVVGLWMLLKDHEAGAEVLAGACSLEQAGYVFKPAQQIVQKLPELQEAFGVQVWADALVVESTDSKFTAIIGQPPDGSNPSCALVDEFHEHVNATLIETMITGMGSREQPLVFITSTAGYNTAGPCKLLSDELDDVLEGRTENDEFFGVNYTVDPDVPFSSDLALQTSNPNLGVSVKLDYLQTQQADAIRSPRKQTAFRTKNTNVWVNAAHGWMNMESWAACRDTEMKIEDFIGQPCFGALDLAIMHDLTGYIKLFQKQIAGKTHYYVFPESYLPEDKIAEAGGGHFQQWERQGYLTAVDGAVNDFTSLQEDIEEDFSRFEIKEIAFDPALASTPVAHMQAAIPELEFVEIGQKWQNLSEPMKTLEGIVEEGRLHHNDPILSWCIANTQANHYRNDAIMPTKVSPEKKIDLTVALIMALARALVVPIKPKSKFKPFVM
jgi:phage terminase large subunit-like protein